MKLVPDAILFPIGMNGGQAGEKSKYQAVYSDRFYMVLSKKSVLSLCISSKPSKMNI